MLCHTLFSQALIRVMSDSPPDADLEAMKRLIEGDDLALNSIMQRWKDKLASFLYRLTGSHEAACDLAQETFVRLYQSRSRYQPSAAFPTYLFHIAANLARNHARWRIRHPAVSTEDCADTIQQMTGHESSPDEVAQHHENTARIERALASLPIEHRQVLLLRVLHGLSASECASALGMKEDQVHSQVSYARRRLREHMEQAGERRREAR